MRSNRQLLVSLAERSYLVDPEGTDADLMEMGQRELASDLRQDHKMGRIAANHAAMTGRRVVVERVEEKRGQMMIGGAVLTPSKEARQ